MAERFFLTAQVGVVVPTSDLKDVSRKIKAAFKSVSTIETKIKTPSNLADFKRKVKTVLDDLSKVNVKISVDTSRIAGAKDKIKKSFASVGQVKIVPVIPSGTNAAIDRLKKRFQSIGVINVKLNLPPNFSTIVKQLSALKGSATVGVSIKGAAGIKAVSAQARAAASNFSNLKDQVEGFGAQSEYAIRRYAAFAVVAANFYALFNAVRGSITKAIEFEKELIKIRQVTGTSIKDLGVLTDVVTNLSTSLGVSSTKLLNVSQILAQAGFNAKDIKTSLDTLAKTELSATFDDITNSAEGMIAIVSQFGTTAEDFKSQFGAINTVSAKFAVESSDIITAVRRTGGVFKAAGGNLNEFIALFTSVRATTRESAESIATGFRTIITRLQRVRTQNFLSQLGIDLRYTREEAEKLGDVNLTNQFVGPYEAVERLGNSLNKIRGTDPRFAQILEELGGFRQIGKSIPLIKQVEKRRQALNLAQRSGNSLDIDAAKAQDSLANRLQKLTEKFDALIRKVSGSESFKSMTDLFLKMAENAIQLTDALTPLLPLLTGIGVVAAAPIAKSFFGGFFGFGKDKNAKGSGPVSAIGSVTGRNSSGGGLLAGIKNNPVLSTSIASLLLPSIIDGIVEPLTGLNHGASQAISRVGGQAALFGGIGSLVGGKALEVGRTRTANRQVAISERIGSLRDPYNKLTKQITREYGKTTPDLVKINKLQDMQNGIATEVIALRANRVQLLSTTKSLRNFERVLPIAALAFGVAAGIMNEVAESYANSAKENLAKKDYSSFESNTATSRGLSLGANTLGATVGVSALLAATGTITGGVALAVPALLALGAGIYGFFSGLKAAKKEVEDDKFKVDFAQTAGKLKAVASGSADVDRNSFSIQQNLKTTQDKLLTGVGPSYETLRGEIGNSILDVEGFLDKIAEGSNTIEEFGRRGLPAIEFLNRFGNISIADIEKKASESIAARNAVTQQGNSIIDSKERDFERSSSISGIIGGINTLSVEFESIGNNLIQFDNLLGDTVNSFKVNFGSKIFEDIKNIGNTRRFKQTASNIGGFFGEAGGQLANEVSSIPDISRALPGILLKLQGQNTFEGNEDFLGRFEDELTNFNVPERLVESLVDKLKQTIGGEAKPDKLIGDIRTDRHKVAGELIEVLEQYTDVFKKAGPEIENALNVIEEHFTSNRRIAERISEHRNTISDIALERESSFAQANDRPENLDTVQSINRQRLLNALGKNSGKSLDELFARRQSLRGGINDLTGQINQGGNQDLRGLTESRDSLTSELDELNRGIKELGQSINKDIEVINKRIDLENKNLQARFEFAKVSAFGSRDDRKRLGINLGGAGILANNPKDIDKIPRSLLPELSSFLESLGDAEIFGKKASDIQKEAIKESLKKGLIQGGLDPKEADRIAEAIAKKQSAKKDSLKDELGAAYDRAQALQTGFITELKSQQTELLTKLDSIFTNLGADLASFVPNSQKQTLQSEKEDLLNKKGVDDVLKNKVETLGKQIGVDLTSGDNIGILKKNLGSLGVLSETQGKIAGITTAQLPKVGDTDNVVAYEQKLQNQFRDVLSQEEISRIVTASSLKGQRTDPGSRYQEYKAGIELDKIKKEKLDKLNVDREQSLGSLGIAFGPEQIGTLLNNLETIKTTFNDIGLNEIDSFSQITDSIEGYSERIDKVISRLSEIDAQLLEINTGRTQPQQFARGGRVPGFGNGDTVDAKLTPGEFVMTKKAVKRLGVDKLNRMNNGVQHLAEGGEVYSKKSLGLIGRNKKEDRLVEAIKQANKILQDNLGVSIKDIVGENVFAGEGADFTTPKGGKARGFFSAGGSQGRFAPNTIGLNTESAGVRTILEEALHALDYKTSAGAKDFKPSSAGEKNPFAKIAKLFGDESGVNSLLEAEGHSLFDADKRKYVSRPSERFAKPLANLLSGQGLHASNKGPNPLIKGMNNTAPDKIKELQSILPSLKEYINKPAVAKRAGLAKNKSLIGSLPVLNGVEKLDKSALLNKAYQQNKPSYATNTQNSVKTRFAKKAVAPQGLKTIGLGGAIGRKIGSNPIVKGLGKGLSTAGKILGPVGSAGIIGESLYEGSQGRTTKGVTGLGMATGVGFAGNVLGNTLNNVGSYLGSGADKVGMFDNNVGNALTNLHEEGGFGVAEARGQDLDDRLAGLNRVRALKNKEKQVEHNKKINANQTAFVQSQNEKAKLGDANYQNSVYSTDIQRRQIDSNRATMNAPSTSKVDDIIAQEEAKKATRIAKDDATRARIAGTKFNPVIPSSTYVVPPKAPTASQSLENKSTAGFKATEDAETRRIQKKYGTPEEYRKSSTEKYNSGETLDQLKKRSTAAYKENQAGLGSRAELEKKSTDAYNENERQRKNRVDNKQTVLPVSKNIPQSKQASSGTAPSTVSGAVQARPSQESGLGFATKGGIDNTSKKPKTDMDIGDLGKAIQAFSGPAVDLAKALNAFPHKIELTATHNVNITHNGAEVFNALIPSVKDLVVKTTVDKLNEFSSKHFKTLPPMAGGSTPKDKQ